MSLVLRSSPPSPFGRKVKIAAKVLGLYDRITVEMADTMDPADSLNQQNPLGKIPILVTPDFGPLFDSRVILEYLDHLAGGNRLLPQAPQARFEALRLQATADGLVDAAILQVYEGRFRPEEKHHQPWLDRQAEKVKRTLDTLEATPPQAVGDTPTVGDIALACALGYLDFRFQGKWRTDYPNLVAWLDTFAAKVPAFAATHVDP